MFRKMRRIKQEISKEECIRILNTEKRGTLAMIGENGYPYAIPLNFYYDEAEEKIYFHSAKEGYKIDAIKNSEKVCFTVCNSGIKKDGDWAYYVTSVVVFGKAHLVTDDSVTYEKAKAIGLKYYPSEQEVEAEIKRDISRVLLVEINIEHITGKLVHEK